MGQPFTRALGAGLVGGPKLPKQIGTGDPSLDLAQIAQDIHAIAQQFVLPPLLQRTLINLTSGTSTTVNSLTRAVGSIIVSVTTGKLDVWISEQDGVVAGTIPDLEFTAVGAPVQIVLPPAPRIFTLLANGATTQGTFWMSSE